MSEVTPPEQEQAETAAEAVLAHAREVLARVARGGVMDPDLWNLQARLDEHLGPVLALLRSDPARRAAWQADPALRATLEEADALAPDRAPAALLELLGPAGPGPAGPLEPLLGPLRRRRPFPRAEASRLAAQPGAQAALEAWWGAEPDFAPLLRLAGPLATRAQLLRLAGAALRAAGYDAHPLRAGEAWLSGAGTVEACVLAYAQESSALAQLAEADPQLASRPARLGCAAAACARLPFVGSPGFDPLAHSQPATDLAERVLVEARDLGAASLAALARTHLPCPTLAALAEAPEVLPRPTFPARDTSSLAARLCGLVLDVEAHPWLRLAEVLAFPPASPEALAGARAALGELPEALASLYATTNGFLLRWELAHPAVADPAGARLWRELGPARLDLAWAEALVAPPGQVAALDRGPDGLALLIAEPGRPPWVELGQARLEVGEYLERLLESRGLPGWQRALSGQPGPEVARFREAQALLFPAPAPGDDGRAP